MLSIFEILVSLSLIVLTVTAWHIKRRLKHPPGPLGFPIFGMLPFQILGLFISKFINEDSDSERFQKNRDKYGPIWSVEYGKQRIVTLSSWNLAFEAFVENADLFSGRPTNSAYKMVSRGRGIILNDGEIWRGHRQLAIKALKDLGMGSRGLENRISEEADDLLSYLEHCCSRPVKMMDALTKGVSNVIIRLVFDERNDYDDLDFAIYANNLRVLAHSDSASRKASIFPKLFQTRIMMKLYPDASDFLNANEFCYKFIRNKCITKYETYDKEVLRECVFDHFQSYRFKENHTLSIEEQNEEIIQAVFDLFNAGVDTTSNLLSFCFLMLGKHQDLQKELREEIHALVGECGQINLEIRKSCPKILSFIDEVHRFCCVVPKVHHRVLKPCVFQGYQLHPDDIIFGDFTTIFNDPALFEEPHNFNAFRFMNDKRTKYCPSKYLIPFGIGKRSCLGESIALMESFIFLARIIHRFKITLPKETIDHFNKVIRGHSGIVHAPTDHLINITII